MWSALTHNYLLISLDYTATPRTLMSRSLGPFSPYFSFKEVLLLLNSPILVLTSPASISLLLRTSHCTATPTSAWHSGCKDDPGWISSQGGALHIDGEGGVPYCIAMNGIGTSIALRWIILHLIGFAGRRHLIAALPLICSDPTLLVSHPDPERSQKLNKGFSHAKQNQGLIITQNSSLPSFILSPPQTRH